MWANVYNTVFNGPHSQADRVAELPWPSAEVLGPTDLPVRIPSEPCPVNVGAHHQGSVAASPYSSPHADSAEKRLIDEKARERDMLLHIVKVERLDVSMDGSKVVVSEHLRLAPHHRQHIQAMQIELLEVGRAVREELDAFRRHLQSGTADGDYMRFLRQKRPDIVTQFERSKKLEQNGAAMAHARRMQQGTGW